MSWVLVVTWDEPESGVDVRGPFFTKAMAEQAIDKVKKDYINEDVDPTEPPEDVQFWLKELPPGPKRRVKTKRRPQPV